jgi:hypothetical protein
MDFIFCWGFFGVVFFLGGGVKKHLGIACKSHIFALQAICSPRSQGTYHNQIIEIDTVVDVLIYMMTY